MSAFCNVNFTKLHAACLLFEEKFFACNSGLPDTILFIQFEHGRNIEALVISMALGRAFSRSQWNEEKEPVSICFVLFY